MERLFLFPAVERHDPAVAGWFDDHPGELGALARQWFDALRASGDDVRELLHDGQPTACAGQAASACVDAFMAHVNLGRQIFVATPAATLAPKNRLPRRAREAKRDARDRQLCEVLTRTHAEHGNMVHAGSG